MRTSNALPELTGLPEQERTMSKSIHLFQCGGADLYGLTQDQTGANLPTGECTGGWRLIKTVEFEGDLPPWGIDAAWQESDAAARAGLAETGFSSAKVVLCPLPSDETTSLFFGSRVRRLDPVQKSTWAKKNPARGRAPSRKRS
jgi:hypothetical protein